MQLISFLDNKKANALYNVPPKEVNVVTGYCGNNTENITLQWSSGHNLTVAFALNETVSRFELTSLRFHINASNVFSDAKGIQWLNIC